MQDIHCHILPGVDDGAQSLDESLAMLSAAKAAGVTSIICTPHVRSPYFKEGSYERMWEAYELFKSHADIPVSMGFEVNHRRLMELGLTSVEHLCIEDTRVVLLELSVGASASHFGDYERTIFELQGRGFDIVIAHPERYVAIQKDIEIAKSLVRMGCKLQLSADFIAGGRLGGSKRPAKKLLKEGLVSYIASDAHVPRHYDYLAKAMRRYGDLLRS